LRVSLTFPKFKTLEKLSAKFFDREDKVLAAHCNFMLVELDFIINYDIKYRLGKELEE
jgi:hypothetical protein